MAKHVIAFVRPADPEGAYHGVQPSEEHLRYLDELRSSGVTNMFGASPYLQQRFGIPARDARIILGVWMTSFGERHVR